MNRSLNSKQTQHTATGAKRSVSLLSSEEELSDRRSSSSIESSQSHTDSKCHQRSTRKAAKKSWKEKFDPYDCQFTGSSTDEEWDALIPPNHSTDSDLDWNPQQSQSRSTAPPKLRSIAMKRSSTGSPSILKSESNLKASDDDQHPSPPKLMAIINKSKGGCPKLSRPPQLKVKPSSEINNKDKISLSVPTLSNCMESASSQQNSSPPILEAKMIFEMKDGHDLSAKSKPPKLKIKPTQKEISSQAKPNQHPKSVVMEPVSPNSSLSVNCKPPKLKVKPAIQKEISNQAKPNQPQKSVLVEPVSPYSSLSSNCKPPKLQIKPIQKDSSKQLKPNQPSTSVLVEPVSPNSREKIRVSSTSPGPPKLSPIVEKSIEKSKNYIIASPLKETTIRQNLFFEDDISESSLEPPRLTSVKKTRGRGSHKSSRPPILIEEVPVSEAIEEDQVSTPCSPKPPNLTSIFTKSKKRSQKSTQQPSFPKEAISILVVPEKDQQISVPSPAALNLNTNVKKSKNRSHKSSRPPVLEETTKISKVSEDVESMPSLIHLKPKSLPNEKVKRKSQTTLEIAATISPTSSMLPEVQTSTPHRPTTSKTISQKRKSDPPSPLPIVKQEPPSEGVQRSPNVCIDFSLSFFGIISHKASFLEKGFESGKFIMLKSDLKTQKSPSIWRIDGKNLLQKYESISYNEGTAYRNISTYSSWMASNKGLYVPIEVEFSVQSKSETIVTFDRSQVMLPIEDGMMEALNEEANSMIDTFQIYLQTLISQALDSNFVKEIVKEQDEYFLSSIAAVEDHWILPKRNMLKEIIKMKKPFQELLETHPGLELKCVTSADKSCDSCNGRNPTRSFEFQTLSYSFDTLDIMEGKPSNRMYRLCLSCTDRILLYHELFHMRYHLFTCCQTKVNQYDQGDGPAALTSSLADQNWKSLMHRKVLLVLAETQQVISQYSADACVI